MIHTKSLIRRLAYVPWLLAFGLVLGWAGEAQAQAVTLTLDGKTDIAMREDGGARDITVKAAVGADAAADINVNLFFVADDDPAGRVIGLNTRFRGTVPSLTIPKGKKEITGTISITPVNDNKRGFDYLNGGRRHFRRRRLFVIRNYD